MAINSPARFQALPRELQAVDADVVGLNEVTAPWLQALCASTHIRETYLVTDAPAPEDPCCTTRNGSLGARMGNLVLCRRSLGNAVTAAAMYTWTTPGTSMDRGPVLVRLDAGRDVPGGPALVVASAHTLAYSRNAAVRRAQLVELVAAVGREGVAGVGAGDSTALALMGDLNLHELQEDGG